MKLSHVTPSHALNFMELGGGVLVALVALGVVMWTALLLRGFALSSGRRGSVESLAAQPPRDPQDILGKAAAQAAQLIDAREPTWRLHIHFDQARRALGRGRLSTDMMIAAAPLLGLLGTITGMIDTFEVLGGGSGAGYSEAMARGISKALITTEFGLVLSIPGILVSRALRRREARIERALDELESRFVARIAGEA